MSTNAQARSTPKEAGFLSRANEGELCFFSGDLPVDSGETGSPSSGKGLPSFCGPRGHQTRHSIPRAAYTQEMIGVLDHQFDWLVPQIVAHLFTSEVFTAEEIRSQSTRSGNRTEVPGAYATKGRGAPMTFLEAFTKFGPDVERIPQALNITLPAPDRLINEAMDRRITGAPTASIEKEEVAA